MTITQQRDIGFLEKYQISKLLTNCYGSVSTTALLHHTAPRPESDPEAIKTFYLKALHPAISRLVKKHPLLSAILVDADKPTARFTLLESYDLRDITHVNPSYKYWEHLSDLIRKTINYEFDQLCTNRLPLWSLQIDVHPERPHECAITLLVHHVIMDGRSVLVFWRDLLNELKDGESSEDASFVVAPTPNAIILPPYEERNPLPPPKLAPLGTKEDEEQAWQGDYEANRDPATATHDSFTQPFKVVGDSWARLVKTSKLHGVTPHAPIMVAFALTFAELYPDRVLRTVTAVNTRPLCDPPVPDDEFGNFFGTLMAFWRPGFMENKSFWDLCIEYQDIVREHKSSSGSFALNTLSALKTFPEDYCKFWTDNWTNYALGRPGGAVFSDLGILKLSSPSTQWRLEEIYFSQTVHLYTQPMNMNSISLPHGLFACISWQNGAVDPKKAEQFSGLVAKKLEECTSQ